MFRRMELFNIASIFLLITSIILIIYTMEREQEFISHNTDIQKSSVQGAAYAINLQLQNKHRHVRLFLDEYAQLFQYLERYPDDERTMDNINRRLQQRFSDFFTFSITDQSGVPILTDFDSLVGDACLLDLKKYVNNVKRIKHNNSYNLRNEVFVHPQPYHYHYDIMTPLQTINAGVQIFFASFYLNEIADILKTHEVPGQTLLLVRQSELGIIEVSKEGARDKLTRDAQLSQDERGRLSVFEDIPDTDWRLVNLPNENFEHDYIRSLWEQVIVILIIVMFALITLVMVLVRISKKSGR